MRVVIIARDVVACQMAFCDRLALIFFVASCNQEKIQMLLLNGFVILVSIMHVIGLCDNRDRSIIVLLWNYRDIGFDYRYRAIMRMRSIIVRN